MSHTFTDLYQSVTDKIINALEAGTAPWVQPWSTGHGSTLPANLSSSRPYRGINVLLLNMQQMAHGYALNRWLTFQQAKALGANVRKGEHGTGIVFFKMLGRDEAANDPGVRKVIPLLRSFTVFNAAQVDGLPEALTATPALPEGWTPVGAADELLERSGATIRHGGEHAFYRPADGVIQLPHKATFADASSYYSVALHELTHWTGAESRCNRVLSSRAHIEAYAFEELVVEMGSAFLSSYCGLPGALQHPSYIAHWLTALKSDKRLIFTAASMAQKAADVLLPATATAAVEAAEVTA